MGGTPRPGRVCSDFQRLQIMEGNQIVARQEALLAAAGRNARRLVDPFGLAAQQQLGACRAVLDRRQEHGGACTVHEFELCPAEGEIAGAGDRLDTDGGNPGKVDPQIGAAGHDDLKSMRDPIV